MKPAHIHFSKANDLLKQYSSPLFVYDKSWLESRAHVLLAAARPASCTVRYALKANPHTEIIELFDKLGLHFDASSEFEARELLAQGIAAEKISLSSQQPPAKMREILESGIKFVATSLHQLDLVAESGWRGELAVRVNPGAGSGHNNRTTTGGISASFGIWHEYIPKVLAWQKASDCKITRLHVHIGSGADPTVWRNVMDRALEIVEQFPDVRTLDIGGGYKVARAESEQETDMRKVMVVFQAKLDEFRHTTGRRINLEIEPGTWLVANAGTLLSTIVDIVDTGPRGYKFIKLDTGMNDILRLSLYGAQHPLVVLNNSKTKQDYVVVGHNCESGDILTPMPGDPERIQPRRLNKASIGDIVAIGGTGAYCASMRARGYNAFPAAAEVLI